MHQRIEPPRIVAVDASAVELVFPLNAPPRFVVKVDREVLVRPGEVLHIGLDREQADGITRDGAVWLGYQLTDDAVLTGGAG